MTKWDRRIIIHGPASVDRKYASAGRQVFLELTDCLQRTPGL